MSRKVVILGAGESGVGAALLAKSLANNVFVSDAGVIKEGFKKELNSAEIEYEEQQHSLKRVLEADVVIKSPGIPHKAEVVQAVLSKEIKLVSEIEYAYAYAKGKIVAITGSNGKTTTTLLTQHLLKKAGVKSAAGGNLGKSFARLVFENSNPDWYVLELSSFQLDDVQEFRPEIAMLLNISPDHLDRYDNDIKKYASAKYKIAEKQQEADWLIYNGEDELTNEMLKNSPVSSNLIKIEEKKTKNIVLSNGWYINFENSSLSGSHNVFNANCALEAAIRIADVRQEKLQAAINEFENAPHRMEKVAELEGVVYINDSKATNIEAAAKALAATIGKTVWIVGGVDKGNDYAVIMDLVEEKARAIVCMGIDNEKIINSFRKLKLPIVETRSVKEAVKEAKKLAKKGDSVLLSPACASFDLFKNYEDRGDQFKEAVLNC